MESLTTSLRARFTCIGDQLRPDTEVPYSRIHHHVLNPCVRVTIPDHVDEPYEVVLGSRGDPSQAVLCSKGLPVGFVIRCGFRSKCVGMKNAVLDTFELTAP